MIGRKTKQQTREDQAQKIEKNHKLYRFVIYGMPYGDQHYRGDHSAQSVNASKGSFRNRKGFDDLRNVERDQEGLPKTGQKGEHPAKTNRLEVMS